MINQYIKDNLIKTAIFSKLNPEQCHIACQHSKIVTLKKNQVLFYQDDDVHFFYYIVSGKIKLLRTSPSGQEKIVEVFHSGQTFAESLMFAKRPKYPVTAEAMEESQVVQIDCKQFLAILRESIETCFLIMADLSQRLHFLVNEIDHLSLQTASVRVASYFLENINKEQQAQKLDLPKTAIASRLSIKPETFSRILKDFSSKKLISVEGSMVTILDRDGLSTEVGV